MADLDPKALKLSINNAEGCHDAVENLVGKLDKTLKQLAKLASSKDVDKKDVQSQIKELQKQMDALQDAIGKLTKVQEDMFRVVQAQ